MNVLELITVKKSFQLGSETIEVLKNIDLCLEEGTTTVVTGESGCGKSTLLNLAGGIDTPDAGHIIYHDVDISGFDENLMAEFRNRIVGFIFQFHFLLKDFTAIENIMMPAIIRGKSFKTARQSAEQLIADVGLAGRKEHYLVHLSGGERQRIAVARSLMNDPALIVADEPTGNLDENNSKLVQEILFELVQKYRKTLLLVTHDKELAKRGNSHYILESGVLKKSGN